MLVKTITYTDYDGNERTEKHYFNLNKAEVVKWVTTSGDYTLDKVLARIADERNGKRIMEIFEDLIHRSYGRKSLDGRHFEKREEYWLEFYESEAYSEMFMEIVSDAKKAAEFVKAIIPNDMTSEIKKIIDANPEGIPDSVKDYLLNDDPTPAPVTNPTTPIQNIGPVARVL